MKPVLPVYLERLRDGKVERFEETIDPKLLDIAEEDLTCNDPVKIVAECYIASDWLIIRLTVSCRLVLPCALCNDPFVLPITMHEYLHEEPLEEIHGDVFDLLPLIRETILLEVPFYPQCGGTTCTRREEVEKYIKKSPHSDEEGYQPFQDLT